MKRIIYLLIPVMVLFVACGNKPINFDNQEEVTKAWSDWENQSDENKEALLKNAKDQINANILEAEACQAKEDSVIAIVDAKWVALQDTTDVEAQKALLDEIKEICKSCCDKESYDKKECSKESCEKKDKEGCCKEWADWANLTPERKAELIAMAIENHNAKKAECESKKAECASKKAEFEAKWNDIDSKTIEEQKAIIDEILASCPEKCCNKEEKPCEKEGKHCGEQESTEE